MAETENTSIINMVESENTSPPSTRTQLINLEGLNTFLEESTKIFEPTLPEGTDGQVLKLSGGKPSWGTDNTPTTFAWTEGTSEGPAGTLSGDGMSSVSFAAIPSASETASGVVTTGAQTFAGAKTFNDTISASIDGNAATSSRLKTAVSLTTTDGTNTSGAVSFDGSEAISIKLPTTIAATFSGDLTGNVSGNATTATTADKTAHSLSVKDGASTPAAAISSWNGSADKILTIKGESPVTTTAEDGVITIAHSTSGVAAGTYRSLTVDAKGHVTSGTNPDTLDGYGITDAKIADGTITLGLNAITPLTAESTLAASKVSGTLSADNIPNLDAAKITTGTISIERLPATALERCVVVANDTARFALTTSSVQVGDTVKVTDTKKMYMVIDSSKLSTEAGYEEYFTSTDWSAITDKPSSFTPAAHSHDAATQSDSGFMSAADKTKLDGIATGANNYTHPAYTAKSSGFYKVAVDGTGHVSDTTAVTKDDITSLGIPGSDTNTHYTAVPVLGASSDTSNATSETLNPYLNIIENDVKSGGIQIKGDGATSIKAINGVVTISSTDNDTTYESKTAVKGGSDVSLVTTGEKYAWNNKANAFTVSSDNPTAAWSSSVVVGTVAGTELKFAMPANPAADIDKYYLSLSGGTCTGNIYAPGFYVSSSRKVKENINPTKVSGEDMINSVSVVDFNYIDDESKSPKVGFIAEDTDPLFSTRERKAMDSANCIGILMKAVQELSTKVKNLTSELETLTSKVEGGK